MSNQYGKANIKYTIFYVLFMKYFFTAPALTKPAFETLQEYSIKKFSKIEKLFKDLKKSELEIKISVTKERNTFSITVEVYLSSLGKEIIVKEKDNDLRRIIDKASNQLKNKIVKNKRKRFDISRLRKNRFKESYNSFN